MLANFHREQPFRRLAAALLARFREIVAQLFVEVAAPLALPNQSHKVWVEDIWEVGHGMGERIALHDDVVHLQQGAFQNSASLLLRRGGEDLPEGLATLQQCCKRLHHLTKSGVTHSASYRVPPLGRTFWWGYNTQTTSVLASVPHLNLP